MKNLKKILYILPLSFVVACTPEFDDEITFTNGSADFSNYVAVGNSLTAGFQSGALRRVRQEVSFPAIIAQQFSEVGGGVFKQPLLAEGVGIGSTGGSELELGYSVDCKQITGLGPVPVDPSGGQVDQFSNLIGGAGPYNNMGIPGAKSFHLIAPGYGDPAGLAATPRTANPFYVRFANTANFQETVAEAVVRANPTFFTLFIGANDVLGYSLQGGDEGSDVITPSATFQFAFNAIVDSLTKNGANGVIANIPSITSLPYFNAIKRNGLELTDQALVDQLNGAYANYNAGLNGAASAGLISSDQAQIRQISFSIGSNSWIVEDNVLNSVTLPSPNGPVTLPKIRQMKSNEYLILPTPQDSLKCGGWGTVKPIPENYLLSRDEVNKINAATTEFNSIIKQSADSRGLGFVDANKILSEMESGLVYGGVTYSTAFVTGGTFSLDGFHPSTRGYAVIANEFIKVINEKYSAKVRQVDPNSYEGIIFPN